MTYAQVIALINANITTNGNNEITGAILNAVLQAMLTQPNDLIGNLTDLNTDVDTDIVAAINWILTQLDGGAQLHSGIPDPNVTPPADYAIGDLYSQTNVGLTPIALWIYTGVSWVNLSGYLTDILESPGVNVDKTIPATPKPWVNDFNLFLNPSFENSTEEWTVPTGTLTFAFVTSAIIASPNNKRAGKFDVGTTSVVKFSNSNSNTYEGKDGVFSFFFMSNTIVTVTVKSDADELISLEIPVTSNWRRFTLPFTADENLSIEISNDDGGSFWLDQMYFGLDVGLGGSSGEFIPLAGTLTGSPVTGDIELNYSDEVKIHSSAGGADFGLGVNYEDPANVVMPLALYLEVVSVLHSAIGIDATTGVPFLSLRNSTGERSAISLGTVDGTIPPRVIDGISGRGLGGVTDFSAKITDLDYTQKIYVDTLQTSGNDITFERPRQFGTFTSPISGAITNTLTGAVIGKVQKIYHQDSSLTVPITWVLISGTYNASQKNIIYVEWCEGTRCEYWIVNL